ncbi:MAG: hypothetical protein AAGE01_15240 [Pseudomonadota bacterium]
MIRIALFLLLASLPPLGHAQIAITMTANGTELFSSPGYQIGNVDLSNASPARRFAWDIVREPMNGQRFGVYEAGALRVEVPLGESTPLLADAIYNNQLVAGAIKFFGPDAQGTVVERYEIAFTGGRLQAVRPRATAENGLEYTEELSISFSVATLNHWPGTQAVIEAKPVK